MSPTSVFADVFHNAGSGFQRVEDADDSSEAHPTSFADVERRRAALVLS